MEIVLIISLIAAVFLGGYLAQKLENKSEKILKLFFSFSGAYLFGVTITHLIPDVLESHLPYIGAAILLGFIFQIFLESLTQGIEHGHRHAHEHENLGLPITVFIGLGLHAFLEGFPMSHAGHLDHAHTWQWGIIIHKIPEAIALMTVLSCSHHGIRRPWLFLLLFSLFTPLGMLIGNTIGVSLLEQYILYLVAFVAGSFIHISFTIIQESGSLRHKATLPRFIAILIGVLLAIII